MTVVQVLLPFSLMAKKLNTFGYGALELRTQKNFLPVLIGGAIRGFNSLSDKEESPSKLHLCIRFFKSDIFLIKARFSEVGTRVVDSVIS